MSESLRQAAGSMLVVGLNGTELTGLERAWLRLVRPGGIILFKRNITDARQTRALLNEATGLGARHAVRCVDVEGGTVNRLRDALAPMPSAQAVGAALLKTRKSAIAREHGALVARSVKAFGFNTTLAPVVDLALPASAAVLGSRPPAAAAGDVIEFASGFLAGLAAQGVVGCGKHFPGLGGASSDTHFETPEIERNWDALWAEDLLPYRSLHTQMPMIMTNHAAYPKTRGKEMPASASTYWITTVLRKQIGYRGIILSDDLEMGGILKFLPVDEAAVAAIRAGSDLLEICHSPELILRSYDALIREAERSAAFRKLLLAAARVTAQKRRRLYASGVTPPCSEKQLNALRVCIDQFRHKIASIIAATDATSPRVASPAEIR
ncbi:MAG TPA: beta-N-acetylhexosaminidase [Terracidiphilus sp.]|nr:beta-N-acetylhexosaminidase [Terracidiphilus sp.]